jgi:hypothetical protein
VKNFAQFVFTLVSNQEPIKLALAKGWDNLGENQFVITQPQLRRTLGIMHTPARITVDPKVNPEGHAAILAFANTSGQHIDKFDQQAEVRRTLKAKAKAYDAFMKEAAELLKS